MTSVGGAGCIRRKRDRLRVSGTYRATAARRPSRVPILGVLDEPVAPSDHPRPDPGGGRRNHHVRCVGRRTEVTHRHRNGRDRGPDGAAGGVPAAERNVVRADHPLPDRGHPERRRSTGQRHQPVLLRRRNQRFRPQGGTSGGCGVPVGATAVAATFTAVCPSAGGYLRAYPSTLTEPTATTLSYGTVTGGTGTTVTIAPSTAQALKVTNHGGPTHLVIDVVGYYVKPLAALVDITGGLYSGSSRALSSASISTGVFDVTFDRDIRSCTAQATVYVVNYNAAADTLGGSSAKTVRIRVFNAGGTLIDYPVYVTVNC